MGHGELLYFSQGAPVSGQSHICSTGIKNSKGWVSDMKTWIKIGIVGSAIWSLVIFVLNEGILGSTSFSNYYIYKELGTNVALGGCGFIWLISYIFYRDKK
tara:strand:+ start:550 stop:852 length:303 start_codon:yes stop_codon:yes gene_type:complete